MNFSRVIALIHRDYLIFLRSRWRWMEFFYFPITSLIIWGMFALWTGEFASIAGRVALVVNVFWSYAYIVQSAINLSMNEDSWHGEGHHLFITGIGEWEYLFARVLFSLLLSLGNLVIMLTVMHFLFFDISGIAHTMLLFLALTAFLSVSLATLIAGLLFMFGRDFAWLSWSALQLFVMLSFPLSPLEILPPPLRILARGMPYGELFQAIRNLLLDKPWAGNAASGCFIGFAYLLLGIAVYKWGSYYSKKSGKFAKLF